VSVRVLDPGRRDDQGFGVDDRRWLREVESLEPVAAV